MHGEYAVHLCAHSVLATVGDVYPVSDSYDAQISTVHTHRDVLPGIVLVKSP